MEEREINKSTVQEKKKELRREIRRARAAHSDEEIHKMSLDVLSLLLETQEFQDAEVIYAYMDCKHEVETSDIIRASWKAGKRVAVPRVKGEEMNFFFIRSLEEDVEEGYFGIREPYEKNSAADGEEEENILMLMPGVAFDESRHRIGYGGGFYDRYLERHPKLKTAALAFEFQVKDEVPFEKFDILPDKVVTERRII